MNPGKNEIYKDEEEVEDTAGVNRREQGSKGNWKCKLMLEAPSLTLYVSCRLLLQTVMGPVVNVADEFLFFITYCKQKQKY